AMAVVLLVVMGAAWIVWFFQRWRGRPAPLLAANSPVLWGLVVAFFVFGVFRWTPWGVWLRP
ncbi:MAG TPA: hypothetical protein VMZ66_07600, partial [Aeromicrobium sp.]|nr:hypothetical protein [Aeromicrobium sp.]